MVSRLRYDETADHVDLIERLEELNPRRIRRLTLVHYAKCIEQEKFVWDLDGSTIIGRDPGRGGIELLDPGSSRRHAEIVRDVERDTFSLRDLGSRNGTFVDGRSVSEVELTHGAVIRIADSIFVFSIVDLPEGLVCPPPDLEVAPARAIAEAQAKLMAPAGLPILILGPTGAGKEVLARMIHVASGRSGKLVAVNCGALNRELVGSELFGHAAGAFSGATSERAGLFITANKGTLLLDEVADLPLDQQPALLRVLQEKTVRPVGSDREVALDVRVIAATHKPLPELVQSDQFRRDLYARLSGCVLNLPGLAARREEVLPLLRRFSGLAAAQISADAAEALVLHDWPENIRELQHLAQQIALFGAAGDRPLDLAALPAAFGRNVTHRRRAKADVAQVITYLDRHGLDALMRQCQGNVATVAKHLGKHRAQVYRMLRKEGLDPDDYRAPDAGARADEAG